MSDDYKNTLNLPQTQFPMKANLAQREVDTLTYWQKQKLYQTLRAQKRQAGCETFILHDGPPYANGKPHMGTALNKILKDIIVKSKTLSGFDAPFIPGWDCHGLPIELNVEKKIGKAKSSLSKKEFRQACRHYANQQVQQQLTEFERLGVLADWQHPYLTHDYHYEADTVRALARIIKQGHVQRGQKPVYWCTRCASALAEAEVIYQDKQSDAIDVAFHATDPATVLAAFKITAIPAAAQLVVPIWTTTPWTLPANQAVCVHPTVTYVLVQHDHAENNYIVLAKDLAAACLQRFGIEHYNIIAECPGQALEHHGLQHPLENRQVPIVLGEHVTTEAGTGCVHTAPAHGLEDYQVGLRYQLPLDSPINTQCCFKKDYPIADIAGLFVYKSQDIIIQLLAQQHHLLHHTTIQHSYPHCWRHKTPLLFRATYQWFISMSQQGLCDTAIKTIPQIDWQPHWGQTRICHMLQDRPDWCISRQRSWGTPITLFIHKDTGNLHPDMPALMEKIADDIAEKGMDAWYEQPVSHWLSHQADDYEKTNDILDVWFDSGVSHFCVLQHTKALNFPADLYIEGSDQHRGWFQSSLLTALALYDKAPFRQVLTHGYVVDGQGRKMSKSLGNVMSPANIVQQFGADVLRLWVSSVDYSVDISVSTEILKRSADAYRRIRNTARFLLSNLFDFEADAEHLAVEEWVAIDRWAIQYTQQLQQDIIQAYHDFQFQKIYQLLHNFCINDMGGFYLDILKDRLYTAKKNGTARRSAQTAMWHTLQALVRWLAPIVSFTAEEIWQHMPPSKKNTPSILLTEWYQDFPKLDKQAVDLTHWQWLRQLRDEVNKLLEISRRNGDIGSALDAEVILYCTDDTLWDSLNSYQHELKFLFISSQVQLKKGTPQPDEAASCAIAHLFIAISPLQKTLKCVRCWQKTKDVGDNKQHANLCQRCITNIYSESGEQRQFF